MELLRLDLFLTRIRFRVTAASCGKEIPYIHSYLHFLFSYLTFMLSIVTVTLPLQSFPFSSVKSVIAG